MYIYKIVNVLNGKVYVGQTRRSIELRFKEHIKSAQSGHGYYLHNAMKKYGIDNFKICVLAETDSIDELNRLELYFIHLYDSVNTGYNLSYGGDSNVMDCDVIRRHHKSVMQSDEVRFKISESVKQGIKSSGRTKEYSDRLKKGYAEYVKSDKFKEDCKHRHLSPEHYRALNDAKNKSVYCIDAEGNVVNSFPRVKDAAIWWLNNGYHVKSYDQLMDRIRESYKYDKYIRGLKWIYRV